jgi:hypothetical protein
MIRETLAASRSVTSSVGAHPGNPAFRRPSISILDLPSPGARAINADIVKAGSTSTRRAPPHAPQRHDREGRMRTLDSGKLPNRRGSDVGLSSPPRWHRQSDEAQ